MQNKGTGTNSFSDGLNTDSHPLMVKNTQVIDALNIELVTVGENQFILKNIPGDLHDDEHGFSLTPSYIPLAVKSYNNIAYIISGYFDANGELLAGELGTYPSPVWSDYSDVPEDQRKSINTKMVRAYAPIHNFLTEEFGDTVPDEDWEADATHIMPFRTKDLAFNIYDFIDLTLQKEYDGSVNFIFTDDRNPVRLINCRFTEEEDGTLTILDRRQNKDTNTYSTRFFDLTELLLRSSAITNVDFKGVFQGGILDGGGYRYYFRYKNQDGNVSDVIAESRLVSIHYGSTKETYKEGNAHGVDGESRTDKQVHFTLSGLANTSGSISVSVAHIYGDLEPIAETYIIDATYPVLSDGTCNITHTGLEGKVEIAGEDINTTFAAISTVRTLDQINNRLVLGNITASIDAKLFKLLSDISQTFRITEEIIPINGGYDNPDNVYFNLGYWAGETYELAVVYVMNGGALTPAYPVRGLDNYDGTATYSGDLSGGGGVDVEIISPSGIVNAEDIAATPGINEFENTKGLYRTKHDKYLIKDDKRQVTRLIVNTSNLSKTTEGDSIYIHDRVIGYFIVRKPRKKDTLYQGYLSPTALMPIDNVEGTFEDYDFISYKRNTYVYPGENRVGDPAKTYLGWDDGEIGLLKSSDKYNNVYDLTVAHTPQYADTIPLIPASGKVIDSEKGKTPRTNRVALYSGDFEVSSVDSASVLNSNRLFLNISAVNKAITIKTAPDERIYWVKGQESESGLTIRNNEGTIQRVGKFEYIPSGTGIAAEGEFTAQIDRTMNFVYTTAIRESPAFIYQHKRNNVTTDPKEGQCKIRRRNKSKGSIMRINFTDDDGKDAFQWLAGMNKGDEIFAENSDDVTTWTATSNPKLDMSGERRYVEFVTDQCCDAQISCCQNRREIVIRYKSTEKALFFPVFGGGGECTAYGFDKTAGGTDTLLWYAGNDKGINKTALWEILSEKLLWPYASVVHNYSHYVGIKLKNDSDDTDSIFEHNYLSNRLYLTEVKASKNVLTAADLAAIFSTVDAVPYASATDRVALKDTETSITVADGDCFITKSYKRTTYPIGIPEAITANMSDFYIYGSGPIQEYESGGGEEAPFTESASYEAADEGRKLASNGTILQMIMQTNHNADVRSYEDVEPAEMAVYGNARGFYPKVDYEKLYTEYREDSKAYNIGLSNLLRVVSYSGIDLEAPLYNLRFPNRVMISSPNIQSEFFNGYRSMSGINYKDYNSELGQITKLINHKNILFCVFDQGVAVITVDGRTLVNTQDEIYIDDAQALASKANVLSATIGSVNPESIVSTYTTVYGVDFIRNKVWRISGSDVTVLSDYAIEALLIDWKNTLKDKDVPEDEKVVGAPKIFASFDWQKKAVYFSYNKLPTKLATVNYFLNFGNVYFSEVLGKWTSIVSYNPKFQLPSNNANLLFDVRVARDEAWETGVNPIYCNFHGIQHTFEFEFLMHDSPSIEKVLTNLQLLSNKVKPDEITYTVTGDVPNAVLRQNKINYYNEDGTVDEDYDNDDYLDPTKPKEVEHIDKIYIREDSSATSIGIFKENAYYKDGKYFVQVGKSNSFSRFNTSQKRIRDKYFKIKIKYTGEDYVYLYAIVSLFTNNYD